MLKVISIYITLKEGISIETLSSAMFVANFEFIFMIFIAVRDSCTLERLGFRHMY